ncbi:phosphotransferase enzyme family protein [Synechocystis sp. CACIAM 05]|uniref:phosphotransferase enzyme family protein n=1 Tax=Synechocystis sp. CACIAM 05 TaxID=1933929 RepID=UPI00138E7877|nr:aminoglycoside phosphotransferase family protein [Synechocystis sp. CACIAM 05]QHU99717.1 aminoglycoside phosphotransferase [Synechocystis sp. CACIAM 05]
MESTGETLNIEEKVFAIADQFDHQGKIVQIKPFGNGNINDTFLVDLDGQTQTSFILQRINHQVFKNPAAVMGNMVRVTTHIKQKLQRQPLERPWLMPEVILTKNNQDHWDSGTGEFWRAISFIAGSESFDILTDPAQAKEVGTALGIFHQLLSDLSPSQLVDTLPGFHHTPVYLQQYQQALAQSPRLTGSLSPEINHCQRVIASWIDHCGVLETAKAKGQLPLRLMHGDPKVNNILFDRQSGHAVSVIDLDTTKPGLIHYDLGDCLRSGCNLLGEETENWSAVEFNLDLCRAMLEGYLPQCQHFLTAADYDYLCPAIALISFELGLRFFTDYLNGDRYFKVKYPEHNLIRALVQFQLASHIQSQEDAIRRMIEDIRG